MCQNLWTMRRSWNVVRPESGEVVPRVKVTAAVIQLGASVVELNRATVFGHRVQLVCPCIRKLRGESVPASYPEDGLQGVVVGVANAVEVPDGTEIGILAIKIAVPDESDRH